MTIFDLLLDATHDLTLSGSDLAVAEDGDIIKQRLSIRLQFLFGEWFLNNQVGMPYTQFIFQQGNTLEDIYSIFRTEILDTEGVENIVSLELIPDPEDKGLRVEFSVNSGSVVDEVEVTI